MSKIIKYIIINDLLELLNEKYNNDSLEIYKLSIEIEEDYERNKTKNVISYLFNSKYKERKNKLLQLEKLTENFLKFQEEKYNYEKIIKKIFILNLTPLDLSYYLIRAETLNKCQKELGYEMIKKLLINNKDQHVSYFKIIEFIKENNI